MLFRAGAIGLTATIASETDDAISLLQMGVAKHTHHGNCGEVPTICPEEGNPNTDVCPEGCKYIESCDMCKKAATFWKRAYGGANNWPNPPRPHGCFRNRKWKIKCNDKGPYGGFKGKWPVCQQICGHAKWVGTKWEKSCVQACPTTTTTTTVCAPGSTDKSDPCEIKTCSDDGSGWITAHVDCAEDMGQPCVGGNYRPAPAGTCCSVCVTTTTTTTKAYVTIVTTSTQKVDPDPDVTCTGKKCIIPQICANGTITTFVLGNMVYNNLNGGGPSGGPPQMKFTKAGVYNGRELDVIVTASSNYRKYSNSWNSAINNQAGMIGAPQGEYTFTFNIVSTAEQEPVTIPYLPMTFYDVDANTEWVKSCEATSFVLHAPTSMTENCEGNCCRHKGATRQISEPSNFERLSMDQKKAAVTYLYEDVSQFAVTWTLTRSAGGFMFMGSKGMACQSPEEKERACFAPRRGWGSSYYCAYNNICRWYGGYKKDLDECCPGKCGTPTVNNEDKERACFAPRRGWGRSYHCGYNNICRWYGGYKRDLDECCPGLCSR